MAVSCRLHLYRSPLKRLSSPTDTSNRLRGLIRGGFLSSFSVPGAGMEIKVDPNRVGLQELSAAVGIARWDPQNSPAWNCWSALKLVRSTFPVGLLTGANGTAPATMPLS